MPRRPIADLLHEQRQPGGIRKALGDAEPIRRAKVIQPAEVANGALADGARGCARGFGEGVVGVSAALPMLSDAAEEHGHGPDRQPGRRGQCRLREREAARVECNFLHYKRFRETGCSGTRTYDKKQAFSPEELVNLG